MRPQRPRTSSLAAPLALASCLAACASQPEIHAAAPCPPAATVKATPPPLPKAETDVPRTLEVRLAPSREGGAEVAVLDVTMRFSVPPVDFGDARPLVLHIGEGAADRVEELAARDSEGSLALGRGGADEASKGNLSVWHAERRARGPMTLSYRIRLPAEGKESAELAAAAGGLVALGRAFLLLPETAEPHAIRVRWDLSGLGEGARGASSLGGEDAELLAPPSGLAATTWAAGALSSVAFDHPSARASDNVFFRAIALGDVPFDLLDVAPWASRVWKSARPLAEAAPRGSFEFFFRPSGKPGTRLDVTLFGKSAVAVADAGLGFGFPEKREIARALVRAVLGQSAERRAWFDEGFVTYYVVETLRRAELAKTTDLLGEIAAHTERYFSSPLVSLPSAALVLDDASSVTAVQQAEDRGFLYAAELDAAIRKASAGKRSLEDALREASPKAEEEGSNAGNGMSMEALRKTLAKEIGEPTFSQIEAVHAGKPLAEMPGDAFGPCFEKVKKTLPMQEPGPGAAAGGKATPKSKTVDGFSWILAKKAPASCFQVGQVGGLQKTP